MDDWDDDLDRDGSDSLSDAIVIHTADTPEELWRALTLPVLRSSGHPFEAVGLFRRHHGQGEPGALKTALLLCTCDRWDPYTGRLVAGLVDTAILSEKDLDELAVCFLWSDCYRFEYPVSWIGTDRIVVDLDARGRARGSSVLRLDPNTPVPAERRIAPPLRRWAAASALRRYPGLFDAIRARARALGGLAGAAVVSGVLDAIEALGADSAREAIALGLDWPGGSVRLLALDLLGAVDLEAARRRAAADPDKKVRAWTGPRAHRNGSSGPMDRPPDKGRRGPRGPQPGQVELFPER